MAAISVIANGLANNTACYSGGALPTSVDDLTWGAFTLTIPNGFTLEFKTLTIGASTYAARSKCIINGGGILKQNGDISFTNYTEIRAELSGVSLWDMNGYTTTFAAAGSVVKYSLTNDGVGKFKITSTVGGTSTITSAGLLDVNGFEVIGTGFRFGGGFYAGNHYRLKNALFQAIGQWGNVRHIEPSNDCIIENVEIRGVAVPTTNVITLFNPEKANANPVTGTQYIDNFLISGEIPSNLFTPSGATAVTISGLIANGSKTSISYYVNDCEDGDVVYIPSGATMAMLPNGTITNINTTTQRFYVKSTSRGFTTIYDMTFNSGVFTPGKCSVLVSRFESMTTVDVRNEVKFRKCTPLNTLSPSGTWKKVWSDCFSNFGDISATPILNSYIVTMANNPHTMENSGRDFQNSIIEINSPSYTGDGSDDFIVTSAGTHLIKNSLILDNYGGTRLNALGVATRTGTYTLDHCTVVVSPRSTSRNYGMLVRNENSGVFSSGATTTVKNTICAIINNPTNSFDVRVFNLETAGNDQIDYLDYNTYSFVGVTPATVYFNVTSATKGAIGSQTGWGLNDQMNVDPQFVDPTRNFFKFINNNQSGLTDAQKIDWYLQSANGYDPLTNSWDPAKKRPTINIDTLLAYVRAGYVVQNPLLNNSGSDGITRGAFAYQAPVVSSGFTRTALSIALSSRALTTRKAA